MARVNEGSHTCTCFLYVLTCRLCSGRAGRPSVNRADGGGKCRCMSCVARNQSVAHTHWLKLQADGACVYEVDRYVYVG